MPIDPSKVQWEDDGEIDVSAVQWDNPAADFSGVTSSSSTKPKKPEPGQRATDGMGQYKRYLAGVGASGVETWKGLKQAGTDAALRSAALGDTLLGALGMEGAQGVVRRNVSAPLARSSRGQMAETAERRALNADLMSTGAGQFGNIVGTAAQLLTPGLALRGTAAASMALPRTVAGSAVQGGVIGAVQPHAEQGERGRNAAVGTVAGFAGSAIPRAAGTALRTAGAFVKPFTSRGKEAIVGDVIRRSATDVSRVQTANPSRVPGVQRTLAEESADPGIGQLQRQFSTQLADRAAANNAARTEAVRAQFRGADNAAIDGIETARDAAANAAMRKVNSATGADPSRLLSQIERAQRKLKGRPHVAAALEPIKPLLRKEVPLKDRKREALAVMSDYVNKGRKSSADFDAARAAMTMIRRGDIPDVALSSKSGQEALKRAAKLMERDIVPEDRVAVLYDARKTINDMIGGKYGGEAASAQAATRELMTIRNALDRVIGKAAPEFRPYMTAYKQASTEADQARVGMTLLNRGKQTADPNTMERVLTPNTLSRAANNPDELVRSATGFRKDSASRKLTAGQLDLLKALGEDASRMDSAVTAGRAPGSDTAQNLATRNILNTMAGESGLAKWLLGTDAAKHASSVLEKTYGIAGVPQRLQEVLVEALENPQYAREIVGRLPPADRALLESIVGRAGGFAGATSPALAE